VLCHSSQLESRRSPLVRISQIDVGLTRGDAKTPETPRSGRFRRFSVRDW
jgi:hypothetical protein